MTEGYLWKGIFDFLLGKRERAFENLLKAEDFADRVRAAIINLTRGWMYYDLGQFDLSQEFNQKTWNVLLLFFPDPWPKKRHHKRRLIQPEFISVIARCMAKDGILHLATDWQPYADHMLEVLDSSEDFINLSPSGDYCERPEWRPRTKYEQRGERLGHEVRDLLYQRRS